MHTRVGLASSRRLSKDATSYLDWEFHFGNVLVLACIRLFGLGGVFRRYRGSAMVRGKTTGPMAAVYAMLVLMQASEPVNLYFGSFTVVINISSFSGNKS